MRGEQAFDFSERQQLPGRGIRVGNDDAAVFARVVVDTDFEVVVESDGNAFNAVQTAVNRVKAVGDIGQQNRLVVFEQGHEGVCQHFVGTVTNKDLRWCDGKFGKVRGNGLLEAVGIGVRVEAQGRAVDTEFALHGGHRVRGRRVGVFVGVQLDQVGQLGLLSRNVRGQRVNEGAPVLAHKGSQGRMQGKLKMVSCTTVDVIWRRCC